MPTTAEIAELLKTLLEETGRCRDGEDLPVDEIDVDSRLCRYRTDTFEERGILTSNDGIVLSLADGSEFQITIVRSR